MRVFTTKAIRIIKSSLAIALVGRGSAPRQEARVVANTWGLGSRSGGMVLLPTVLVDKCLGEGGAQ